MADMFADSDEDDNRLGNNPHAAGDLFGLLTSSGSGSKRKIESETSAAEKKQKPKVDKGQQNDAVAVQECIQLLVATAEDRGSRPVMEDVWVIHEDAREDKSSPLRVTFCGVFDGHGGTSSANFASENLHKDVLSCGLLKGVKQDGTLDVKHMRQAILDGFKLTDQKLLVRCAEQGWADGATAVAVWVIGETVLVANIGDAKCVLARRSDKENERVTLKALVLTKDHKAIYPLERSRIEKHGGIVTKDGRLEGRIEISRAFGDRQFKKKGMTAVADIQTFTITPRDEFMVCACDGFWGVFDPKDAVQTAAKLLEQGRDVKACCNRIINEAVRERRCKDNCTIMLIRFVRRTG